MRKITIFLSVAAILAAALAGVPASAGSGFPRYSVAKLSEQNGGEPSIAAGPGGWLYVAYPGPASRMLRSRDFGSHWTQATDADSSSADNSVNVDSRGVVYQGNLNGNLQTDMYSSNDHGSRWTKGHTAASTDSSHQTFLVDRPWTDAYAPPGKPARVYASYHDFGPSQVWVNTSTDGGKSFGEPVNVVNSTEATTATICNSSPAGVRVVPGGPHAGRVYVAWLAADVATSVATGCNYTQMDTFHTIWIAWSDDEGKTWTDHLVSDAGFGHDAAAFWGDLAVDSAGNPYIAVADNLAGEWDVFVFASFDNGATWNGASDGSGAAVKVNGDYGTHYFPAIAVSKPGMVAVTWIATPMIVPTLPYGKPAPGGVADARWNVYVALTRNFRSPSRTWRTTSVTAKPMHIGDVCTLGIFCIPELSDRNLLDFIDVAIDSKGFAHVAYTDDADRHCICVANQIAGTALR